MKKIFAVSLITLFIFAMVGCGTSEEHIGEAKTPSGSSIQQGRNYQEVVADFEENGFTNIKLVKIEDLITGWLTNDGEVDSVSVDGNVEYSPDKWYPQDVEVIISYHTFPSEDSSEISSFVNSSPESNTNSQMYQNDFLTIDNNVDLAHLLSSGGDEHAAFEAFAKTYANETIEFSGCIIYVANHGDYTTRYDILLNQGDYVDANTSNSGPIFKFENVATVDLGISDLSLPSFVAEGKNVTIQATIDYYDMDEYVFYLTPISLSAR